METEASRVTRRLLNFWVSISNAALRQEAGFLNQFCCRCYSSCSKNVLSMLFGTISGFIAKLFLLLLLCILACIYFQNFLGFLHMIKECQLWDTTTLELQSLLETCQCMTAHISQSIKSSHLLKGQRKGEDPEHQLIQDMATCCNSTYAMIISLVGWQSTSAGYRTFHNYPE